MRRIILIISAIIALLYLPACTEAEAETPPPTQVQQEPSPTADPLRLRAEEILSQMSESEKLCQLMIVRPEALTTEAPVTEAGEESLAALRVYPVAGLIFSADNLRSREQSAAMIEAFQNGSSLGLFICADEEGGSVSRLMQTLGTTRINSMYSYREQGPQVAYDNAYTIGRDMADCGFNTDFAPVADVRSNPENSVIGTRAYSDDFEQAAELVAAAVRGFRASGVLCSLKHFPGHGDTSEDSHLGPAVSYKTAEQLFAEEFLPFISGMEAGADMVMAGHISVPAIDDKPASLSYIMLTEILRGQLGWQGLIVTDGLDMGALDGMTESEKCLSCLYAGCDLLLGVSDIEEALQGLQAALESGELSTECLDESVLRVLYAKLSRGIIA